MTHYSAQRGEPPFDFSIDCTLNNYQKSCLRKKFFKKEKKEKKKIHHITLSINTITTDSNRVWVEIQYNPGKNIIFSKTEGVDIKKVEKILGEKFMNEAKKRLEERREELLN